MMRIESRITALENQAQKESPPELRFVVSFVPSCLEQLGVCEHVVAAKIDGTGKVFHRIPGETVDALTERATAAEIGQHIHVSYVTTHDDLDEAAWDALAARSKVEKIDERR